MRALDGKVMCIGYGSAELFSISKIIVPMVIISHFPLYIVCFFLGVTGSKLLSWLKNSTGKELVSWERF